MPWARTTIPALAMVGLFVAASPSLGAAAEDPLASQQWNLRRVRATEAWPLSTGAGVRIGVVDSGVDLAHEDLAGRVLLHANCIGAEGDPARCGGSGQDDQGHGTHVAGIAAATRGNGRGIAGMAPGAGLVVAKVLDASAAGTVEDVSAGIRWVVDHGARVVNLSLGDPVTAIAAPVVGNPLAEALRYAWSRGAVPVVAAGNSNLLGLGLEGSAYEGLEVVVVAATDPEDRVAHYSGSTGAARWALLAPGGSGQGRRGDDVISTVWAAGKPDSYGSRWGTSMAAAHVSGAVALLLAEGYGPGEAVRRMLEAADDSVGCGPGSGMCRGLLDVAGAVGGEAK